MNEEKLKELGFELIKEYVYGDNDEFVTQVFRKGVIEIDLNFDKKTGLFNNDDSICINGAYIFIKLTLNELKQLDKILNK